MLLDCRRRSRGAAPLVRLVALASLAIAGCEGRCSGSLSGGLSAPGGPSAATSSASPVGAAADCAKRDVVTFFVASDTHFGFSAEVERRDLEAIRQMNTMEGAPWPEPLGGSIGKPCGVLVAGDLTEDGKPEEWGKFVSAFGLRGGDGALAFPAFEALGNHDKHHGAFVQERIAERHGAARYSFDWGPVHVVSLGEGPSDDDLVWLDEDLKRKGQGAQIVLYFHYPLEGRWATGHWFGDGPHRDRLRERLEGKNVLGIFHGHDHAAGNYEWRGIDIYRTGSPKHAWHTFAVVEIGGGKMKVASWDYSGKTWVAWHSKPTAGEGPEVRWVDPRLPR